MTQDEKIKWNLQHIVEVAIQPKFGVKVKVHYIRSALDHIEKFLQEPESGTVVRLTETCKQLTEENHELKQQIEKFRAGWCPFDCASPSRLQALKERNDKLKQNLNTVERNLLQWSNENRKLKRKLARIQECAR